jgi:hypothetical protein
MTNSISGYGVEFELRVSQAVAQKLIGNVALPRMGYEVDVKTIKEGSFTTGRLGLQNISGTLVLASYSHERKYWKDCFGIDVPAAQVDDSASGFGVIAHQYHGDVLRSFHGTAEYASSVLKRTVDTDPLRIEAIKVNFAKNGNIRLWNLVT